MQNVTGAIAHSIDESVSAVKRLEQAVRQVTLPSFVLFSATFRIIIACANQSQRSNLVAYIISSILRSRANTIWRTRAKNREVKYAESRVRNIITRLRQRDGAYIKMHQYFPNIVDDLYAKSMLVYGFYRHGRTGSLGDH